MNIYGGLIGGIVGGLIGAAIWGALGYFTGYEVGWIAWLIGAIVGSGVSLGTKGQGGRAGSVMAVAIAIAAVLLGKWAVVFYAVHGFTDPEKSAIAFIANVIMAEQEEQGRQVVLPNPEDAVSMKDVYPESIWNQAKARWDAKSPEEQEEMKQLPLLANPDFVLVNFADGIISEYQEQNKPVNWPPGYGIETAWRRAHYPEDVWADTVARWEAMSPEEQETFSSDLTAGLKAMIAESQSMFESEITKEGFFSSFSPFDLLWIILAVGTAAKLGHGRRETEVQAVPAEPEGEKEA